MAEIIFVLLLILGMLGTSAFAKQWRLFFVFLTFFVCFGLQEWLSVAQTNLSISQHVWALHADYPIKFWILIVGMAVAWGALLYHFITGKKKNR